MSEIKQSHGSNSRFTSIEDGPRIGGVLSRSRDLREIDGNMECCLASCSESRVNRANR